MQFPRECKLWTLLPKTERRGLAIHHARLEKNLAQLDGEAGLVATDGHALALVRVDEAESDTEGFVSGEALKAAAKPDGRHRPAVLLCNGELRAPFHGMSFSRLAEGAYPTWQAGLPAKGRDGAIRFAVDANLLSRLADALGAHEGKVILEITRNEKGQVVEAIRVDTFGGQNVGAIMPVHLGD